MKKAAFFDRDGTINVNYGHVYKLEDLTFVDGVPEIIREFNKKGILVIVVTNQAGIAKKYYSEQDMHRFNEYMNKCLMEEFNAHIDTFYFCPHHPDYTGECNCRKPKPGMILQAAEELDIDISNSLMYGDKETDEMAAKMAGIGRFYYV